MVFHRQCRRAGEQAETKTYLLSGLGLVQRHVRVGRAVGVGEGIAEDEPMRRRGFEDLPVAARLVALRPGHVVLDPTASP